MWTQQLSSVYFPHQFLDGPLSRATPPLCKDFLSLLRLKKMLKKSARSMQSFTSYYVAKKSIEIALSSFLKKKVEMCYKERLFLREIDGQRIVISSRVKQIYIRTQKKICGSKSPRSISLGSPKKKFLW